MKLPSLKNTRTAFLCLALSLLSAGAALADAAQDWQKILALDEGPKGEAKTREEARKILIQVFDQREQTLRHFIAAYPTDPHNIEARMRLSHLLAIRNDIEHKPQAYAEAMKILTDLEASSSTPKEKLPDIAYARITLAMHNVPNPDEQMRNTLMAMVRKFQRDYPTDHRNGDLLAEIATLYDNEPAEKQKILMEAVRYASDPDLKARLNDDFKRLGLLNKPLDLKFESIQGQQIDVANYRGRVVMIYFFANWSQPSIITLTGVKQFADTYSKNGLQVIGICLDRKRESIEATVSKMGLNFPIYFDGKGWESPLARSLGINALPTTWLLDRKGNLRTLNAMNNTEDLILQLLQEK